jgi:hypothetical protein
MRSIASTDPSSGTATSGPEEQEEEEEEEDEEDEVVG